jgi:hypothetical protein
MGKAEGERVRDKEGQGTREGVRDERAKGREVSPYFLNY